MRSVGVDLHKHYALVVELSRDGTLKNYRVSIPSGLRAFCAGLSPTDQVVVEVSTNSFRFGEVVEKHVDRVVICEPFQLRGVVPQTAMNDQKAAEGLARLLQTGFVRAVWAPPPEVRALRCQVDHYRGLDRLRSQAINRIRSLFQQELTDYQPGPTIGAKSHRDLNEQFQEQPRHRLYLCSLLRLLNLYNAELAEIERSLGVWCRDSRDASLLMTIPGMGPVLAATILSQIGDIKRFSSPEKLCSYAGLVPRVYQSGTVLRRGRITRAGSSVLRWALGLCMWSQTMSKFTTNLKEFKLRLASRGRPQMVAQVAACRKLLAVIWNMLEHQTPFQQEDQDLNSRKKHRLSKWPEPSPEAFEIPKLENARPSRKSIRCPGAKPKSRRRTQAGPSAP